MELDKGLSQSRANSAKGETAGFVKKTHQMNPLGLKIIASLNSTMSNKSFRINQLVVGTTPTRFPQLIGLICMVWIDITVQYRLA
jgi:hypothetical protein